MSSVGSEIWEADWVRERDVTCLRSDDGFEFWGGNWVDEGEGGNQRGCRRRIR